MSPEGCGEWECESGVVQWSAGCGRRSCWARLQFVSRAEAADHSRTYLLSESPTWRCVIRATCGRLLADFDEDAAVIGRAPITRLIQCPDGKWTHLPRSENEVELLLPSRFRGIACESEGHHIARLPSARIFRLPSTFRTVRTNERNPDCRHSIEHGLIVRSAAFEMLEGCGLSSHVPHVQVASRYQVCVAAYQTTQV